VKPGEVGQAMDDSSSVHVRSTTSRSWIGVAAGSQAAQASSSGSKPRLDMPGF
jgi:hypothetical protein